MVSGVIGCGVRVGLEFSRLGQGVPRVRHLFVGQAVGHGGPAAEIADLAVDLFLPGTAGMGREREASMQYQKASATIARMAAAVEDDGLASTFLQSALVQEIQERTNRLGD